MKQTHSGNGTKTNLPHWQIKRSFLFDLMMTPPDHIDEIFLPNEPGVTPEMRRSFVNILKRAEQDGRLGIWEDDDE